MTEEALIVPGQGLKSHKFCAPQSSFSCDRLGACSASFGKEFSETFCTIWKIISGGESLTCQSFGAICAGETFTMIGIATVGDASAGNYFVALNAFCSELVLVASSAVDVILLGDEGFGSDGVLANTAHKTLLVPLSGLVLHLLHPRLEHVVADHAPGGELGVVAGAAVDAVSFGPKLLVHQAGLALAALEAALMPVLLFVREILAVNANDLATLITVVGKHIFITFDTEWMIFSQDISVTGKTVITLVTKQNLIF